MADLLARFKLVDEMSDKLGNMAEQGQNMADQWERAGSAANSVFEGVPGAASAAVSSVDGVATSIDSLQGATGNAASSADTLAGSMDNIGNAAGEAAAQTDYWTDAVGNYDKSLLEAVYSTEELVEMGLKSADALEEQERMFDLCEQSAAHLSKAIEATSDIQSDLAKAMDDAGKAAEEMADNDKVSAETKEELQRASETAAQAMEELTQAQEAAEKAMQNYDTVITSGTTDLNELEAAAEQAEHAAENLAEANGRASEATEELSRATERASEEADNAGKSGTEAIQAVANMLASAGIIKTVQEIGAAVYELADDFSEAEKQISSSTGATGQELDNLTESAQRVFSNSNAESLEQIATGMTNIASATNLTGEALERATEKGYALENLFGYEMGESARTASALMKNFNITAEEAYDIIAAGAQNGADKNGDLLDVLNEYSNQYAALGLSANEFISSLVAGAEAGVFSIDKVGDAVKEFNIRAKDGSESSAEAFELLGMNAETMTAKFAAGGEVASAAFYDVVNALEAMDDPVQKNAAAVALFGTQYEDLEANLLPILSSIEGGTLDTADALSIAAENSKSMGDGWKEAGNSIKSAFSSAISPTIEKVSSGMSGIAKSIGKFLQDHPAVTKAITAIGVGLGVVAVGIAGVSVVTTVIPAITAFGVALNAALGPIGWVALAITGLTAAGIALAAMFSDAEDETANMTQTTRQQYYELQDLNAEYEEACAKYGETSEEASRLKYQVDDLSESFEANRQTLEEFEAEVDSLCESVSQVTSDFNEAMSEIDAQETGTLALIQKYEDLATQTELTGAEQKELEAVTKKLSEAFPELSENIDAATMSAEDYVAAMKQALGQEAEEQRQAEAQEAYVEALKKRAELTEEIEKAEENLRLSEESDANATFLSDAWFYDKTGWLGMWATQTNEYKDALEELNAANAENEATIAEIEAEWEKLAAAEEEAAEQTMTYEQAAATAYQNVQAEIEELCEKYDEAYEAALESFEGQFGLFDEASMKSEEYLNATVSNAQEALDSQLAYWDSYNTNLETLTAYGEGLTGEARENYEALLEYAQSGSEEAAGLAASMAEAINSGNTEAVNKLSETMGQVTAKQEEVAAATADWQTNFTEQMNQYQSDMEKTINDMNLSDEAKTSATATVNSYAEAIRAGKGNAVSAAKEVANAVTAALASASTTVNVKVNSSGSVSGHANGTTNAESVFLAGEEGPELVARKAATYATGTTDSTDYFIAGENGPELIVGEQGSTVFPTEETDRLINALNTKQQPLQIFAGANGGSSDGRESTTEQVKRILLEIAGSGAIEVGGSGGADKETILEILYEHLKPVLMSLIQSEIYEEGELSYEY